MSSVTKNASLSECLSKNREDIINEWKSIVRTDPAITKSSGLDEPKLVSCIPELLARITSIIERYEEGAPAPAAEEEALCATVARAHAGQRFQAGYKLTEAVRELVHFRTIIIRVCIAHGPAFDGAKFELILAVIDDMVSVAAGEIESLARDEVLRTIGVREAFLGMVVHDLRQPLTSIELFAKALLLQLSEDTPSHMLRMPSKVVRIVNAAERMGRMIGDLLDVVRGRLGEGIAVRPEPIDLRDVCVAAMEEQEIAAYDSCSIHFECRGSGQGNWEKDRMLQVVGNLLSNALKYGSPNSAVILALDGTSPDEVVLSVHNEGVPISADEQLALFDPFVRLQRQHDARLSSREKGVGLGLYIVSELVKAHGGSVEVRSGARDGTTFTVRLPREPT